MLTLVAAVRSRRHPQDCRYGRSQRTDVLRADNRRSARSTQLSGSADGEYRSVDMHWAPSSGPPTTPSSVWRFPRDPATH